MAKVLEVILFALCALPALVLASEHYIMSPFDVHGRVYCDTCRAGFETNVTRYLPGAKVQLQCVDSNSQVVYTNSAVTDSYGNYVIQVAFDHNDETCDVLLVSSSDPDCAEPSSGRDRSRVIVTRSNGMISNIRYANSMGFLLSKPLVGCAELIRSYFIE